LQSLFSARLNNSAPFNDAPRSSAAVFTEQATINFFKRLIIAMLGTASLVALSADKFSNLAASAFDSSARNKVRFVAFHVSRHNFPFHSSLRPSPAMPTARPYA
jgi:hypothetical protein